jgi:hypothetical protein
MENRDGKLGRNIIFVSTAIFLILLIIVFIFGKQFWDLLFNPSLHVTTSFFGLARFQILNLFFCLLFFLVFSILGYKKAKQMGRHPFFWAIVCFVLNFWGYIYLLYSKKRI